MVEKPRQPEKGTFLGVFQASQAQQRYLFRGGMVRKPGWLGSLANPKKVPFLVFSKPLKPKKVPFFGVGWLGSPDGWEPVKGTFVLFVFRFYLSGFCDNGFDVPSCLTA